MVVKTWEKVKIDKWLDEEDTEAEERLNIQLIFQIKTLRIFDVNGQNSRNILVE